MGWHDIETFPFNKRVIVLTISQLERRARRKRGAKPRRHKPSGILVMDCWGTSPVADLVAVKWKPERAI